MKNNFKNLVMLWGMLGNMKCYIKMLHFEDF